VKIKVSRQKPGREREMLGEWNFEKRGSRSISLDISM